VAGFEYPPKCDFKMADGTDCPVPATHFWGTVKMCCTHFDLFAPTLFQSTTLPYQPSHLEIIQEYDRQCGRASLIAGTKCRAKE
jgi:hypothetical protein